MLRKTLPFLLIAAAVATSVPGWADPAVVLKSLSVSLPETSATLPPGPASMSPTTTASPATRSRW